MFDQVILSIEHIRAGRLRALAVTERGQRRGCCPTFRGVAISCRATKPSPAGIGAPKGTPPEFSPSSIARSTPASPIRSPARLVDLGGVPMPMTPADFGQLIAGETEKWGKVIKFAKIKPKRADFTSSRRRRRP